MSEFELVQGRILDLEVVKESCDRKKFRVKTPDGNEYSIQKFKFQYDLPLPDSLSCYVKQLSPSVLLGQDISVHIKNFYEEGKEYDFNVIGFKNDPHLQFDLKDNNGLCFKLNNPSLNLTKGDRVKCKIIRIRDANVTLQYVGTLSPKLPLKFYSIERWLKELKINSNASYYEEWLNSIPEFEPIMEKYYEKDPTWILDTLQASTTRIPQWLIDCKEDLLMLRNIKRKMEIARKISLYILEESDYLRDCSQEDRTALQSKLSNYTELFDQFSDAMSIILTNAHEEYIDKMFRRLKEAGYLYQPKRQIRIMMTILKLRPELINARMGELFETLHNWNINNWQSEPFREALVQQLQIFIEENYGKVNLVALNDTTSDNKVISRLILALAVQRLLTSEKDGIDLNLNRAILYRYTSYLMPDETITLLQNAIDAILGFEWSNEFSWENTETPSLLFNKTCNLRKTETDEELIIKTFATSKAQIQLQKNKLHIIATGADPETTVIPNNMFDWLEPQISLSDPLSLNIGKKNKNQLKDYKKMWDEIRLSIFRNDDSNFKPIEKRLPSQEEEVKIIIDGVRTVDDVHDKQRLQFHCTIHDDLFYGEGWMPCDNFHMVPWLTYRDIPNNYDGSIKFAKTENDRPLIFKGKVYKRNGNLVFSLKDEIENRLIDTNYTGLQSVAIITALDKANNVWISLTENGASYKIPYDSTTSHLSVGKIVRINYFERDLSNANNQFFIGTLSDNQEGLPTVFNKNIALFNLMQNLGEIPDEDEDFEVVESEQIMTHEELVELIYILRRRAYWEQEYSKAYNYLGLASILVRMAEEPGLLEEITIHMELLEVLQEFGKNRKVENSFLEKYDNKLENSPMLERLYTRLKLVAQLDSNDDSGWLWERSQKPRNETEGILASLVLSHNLLPKDMVESRENILEQISTVLKVNSVTNTAKYYGVESQTTEFKSSLVYSAKGGSKPAVKEQMWEITHVICGFMNARGGTLYIGVNDGGYENGLDDDIAYRKRTGQKTTIDAMIIDLQNHLDKVLPWHAKDHWEIKEDSESKKGVIIVDILPVRTPVELDGTIYVRSSSSTKPRLNEEREEFIKNRPNNYDNLIKLWEDSKENTTVEDENHLQFDSENIVAEKNDSSPINEKEESKVSDEVPNRNNPDKISTGKHRYNVLHAHEDNFTEPAYYIYFNNDSTLSVSDNDYYREEDEDCMLVLAVKEKERDSFITFGYDDNRIIVVPLQTLASLPFEQKQELKKGGKLKNVNIAYNNDYLLSVIKASSGSLFYRLDKVESLPHSVSLKGEGNVLCEHSHKIITQEIITGDQLTFFDRDSIDKDNKSFGTPIPIGNGTWNEEEKINALLAPVEKKD